MGFISAGDIIIIITLSIIVQSRKSLIIPLVCWKLTLTEGLVRDWGEGGKAVPEEAGRGGGFCPKLSPWPQMMTKDIVRLTVWVRYPQLHSHFYWITWKPILQLSNGGNIDVLATFPCRRQAMKRLGWKQRIFWFGTLRNQISNSNIQNRRPWDIDRSYFRWPWYVLEMSKVLMFKLGGEIIED